MRARPGLRRRLGATLATLWLCPVACFHYADVKRDDARRPIMNTGVSATVLYPGQRPPALPAPPPAGNLAAGAPSAGSSAGSSSGTSTGAPGAPQAPQAGATATSPAGGGPATNAPTSSGYPDSTPVLLGGTESDEVRHRRIHDEPLWTNPFWTPIAIVLYPFRKVRDLLQDEPEETVPSPPQAVAPATPAAREDVQAAYERAQREEIERQLARQGGSSGEPPRATPPLAAVEPTRSGPLSIAEELAALRARSASRNAPGASPEPPMRAPNVAASLLGATPAEGPAEQMQDRDADGRPDHWVHRRGDRLEREAFDDDGDGVPDRVVIYDPSSGQRVRVEEDTNRDGRIDTWSYYANEQLTRRRADLDGDGAIDVWTFYRGEQVVRHEEDHDGDGFRDRIDFYADGTLARREEDRDGNGRTDRITRFDASGAPLEQEEDTDGDGRADVRSYYVGGRLVRRELLSGLAADREEMRPPPAEPPSSAP